MKQRAEVFNKRKATNSVAVTTVGPQADPNLSVMNSSSFDSGNNNNSDILLDSGSDRLLFNRLHYDLLFSLKPHDSALTGIGGDTGMRITHRGDVILMGTLIHDVLYSPLVDRSVVSEAIICALFDFKIEKDGKSCILINKANNIETTLQLDLVIMK